MHKLTLLLLTVALAGPAWSQEDSAPDAATADTNNVAETGTDGSAEVEASEDVATVEEDGSAALEDTEEVDDMDDGVLDAAFDDASLDEQTYEEDEDDFIPSEEIPADQPIPFPSNI